MSLVNEALKKARLEAARGEAANRGIPYPALGTGDPGPSQAWIVALALTVILAGIGGFLLYRAGKRSALEQQLAAQQNRSGSELSSTANVLDTEAHTEPADILFEGRPRATPPGNEVADYTRSAPSASPRSESPEKKLEESTRPEVTPAERPVARPAVVSDQPAVGNPTPTPARVPEPVTEAPREAPVRQPVRQAPAPSTQVPPIEAEAPEAVATESAERVFVRRAEIPGVGPVELGGIAWSGDRPFALINGRVVRPGDSVAGLTVGTIEPNRVSLRGDAGTLVFKLK